MMGDRNYRHIITDVKERLSHDIKPETEKDNKIIHFSEVTRCLRRSYFDRVDPLEQRGLRFSDLFRELMKKMPYGSVHGEFSLDNIKLKIYADMIVDDVIIIFRPVSKPPEKLIPSDALYLNACLWILKKTDGIILYFAENGDEVSFSLIQENKMFEESIRRVRILNNLLEEKKIPVLEPSSECITCQYYERCYLKEKKPVSFSIESLLGFKEEGE
jgi:CRISPR-associated exonuclease Cas4